MSTTRLPGPRRPGGRFLRKGGASARCRDATGEIGDVEIECADGAPEEDSPAQTAEGSCWERGRRRAFARVCRPSAFHLGRDQAFATVNLAELRLFDFARGVAGDIGENDLPRTLIAGHALTELFDFFLRAGMVGLQLDDGGDDLAQPRIGQADHGDILDGVVGAEKVLDLDGGKCSRRQ